ncbi:hypothetical protein C0J52_25777 [Blattella germanica]|nr:hypothetical protein C0J52_25777 [Blattella germanica]
MKTGRGLRVAMAAPAIGRRRTASCLRTAVFLFLVTFVWLQLHVANLSGGRAVPGSEATDGNDSAAAILSMVPQVLHKFLTPKPRNASHALGGSNGSDASGANAQNGANGGRSPLNISEIRRNIERYNDMQQVLNEELFGPVQNDSLIIVVQVHTRIIYLRHLIVSLAQARDIETVLLVFSHDYYDEEINELVQSVDFCKVMQIFYPYSIQTHLREFPGESPGDCPRNIKKEQAKEMKCNNYLHPDLYGMVLFLEEDHFVAEDFIHVMRLMERTCRASCDRCNILSLGTYLKTYNYYGDSKKKEAQRALKRHQNFSPGSIPPSWSFQILPTLYQHYQKVDPCLLHFSSTL